MKSMMCGCKSRLCPAFLLFLFCLSAYCKDDGVSFEQGGFRYFVSTGSTVSISDAGPDVPLPVSADSTLVIPSSVRHEGKDYRVERINVGAFNIRQEIKRLVVSEGVEYIDRYAFDACFGLTDVSLPSTLIAWDEWIFDGCGNLSRITVSEKNERYDSRDNCNAIIDTEENTLLFGCRGTQVPPSVTAIDRSAFCRCCQQMESIVIPEGVKRIEPYAFSHCINLKEISLPASLEAMGYGMFKDCMSLESVNIPRNVSVILGNEYDGVTTCWNLFGGCYNLKKVTVDKGNRTFDSRDNCNAVIDSRTDAVVAGCGTSFIPKGVTAIGEHAFEDTSLPSILIPRSVRKIGGGAFLNCRFCSAISVAPGNPVYDSRGGCNAIIETASGRLVQGCGRTVIPDGTKEIGDSAFYGVHMPPRLIIPEGVETIGSAAFTRFCGLVSVQLPSTLKRIKTDAFMHCEQLYYVDMSRCNPQVEGFAFSHCKSLNFVRLPSTPSEIHEAAFFKTPFEELWKSGTR